MEELIEEYIKNPFSLSFQEKLFEYYKQNNFMNKYLQALKSKLGLTSGEIKDYIYTYAKNVLNMSKEEFLEYAKDSRTNNAPLFIGKENIILLKYGIKTNFLWTNEKEKILFLEDIYMQSREHNFDLEFSRKMAKEIGIMSKRYLELLRMYLKECLNKSDEEIKSMSKLWFNASDIRRIGSNKLTNAFEKIIDAKTVEEIEKAIKESGRDYTSLINDISLYKKYYSEEKMSKFFNKCELYKHYRDEKNKENKQDKEIEKRKEKVEKIKNLLDEYLNSNKILKEFVEENKMKDYMINNYLQFLKENDTDEYDKYFLLLEERRKKEEEYIVNCTKNIIDGINYGYEENGIHRDFDVLDYYFITNTSISVLLKMVTSLVSDRDYYTLKKINKYGFRKENKPKEFKGVLKEKLIVDIKKDSDGNIIPDSGREILNEEKENVFNFLTENGIPFNNLTYRTAIKRYTKGLLEFHIPTRQVMKLTNKETTN